MTCFKQVGEEWEEKKWQRIVTWLLLEEVSAAFTQPSPSWGTAKKLKFASLRGTLVLEEGFTIMFFPKYRIL